MENWDPSPFNPVFKSIPAAPSAPAACAPGSALEPRCANIFSMNLDGTGVTPLTTDNENTVNFCPKLSPDGSKVAFVKEKITPATWKPIYELCVMNADGTDVKTIYSYIPEDSDPDIDTVLGLYPSWTPGGLIVFSEYHTRSVGRIKVITDNGAILKTYSSDLNLGYCYSAPRASPDGNNHPASKIGWSILLILNMRRKKLGNHDLGHFLHHLSRIS